VAAVVAMVVVAVAVAVAQKSSCNPVVQAVM
jgi:hypothetical protein